MASAATNGEEPPSKKKKTELSPNPSLPDDLVVSCLARVSRLHYPTLSFVSKSFRSLIASPELYQTRSLLNRTERCLYVCLHFPSDPNPRWFTLYRKPVRTLNDHIGKKKKKKKESSGYILAPISFTNSPPLKWSHLVSVDRNLYAIRGPIRAPPCSNVSFLDCTTHTWLEAQSLRLAHTDSSFDGNMYLAGSCENPESLNCIEVFSTKTQTWKPVPPEKRIFKPLDMEGKIHTNSDAVSGRKGLTLKPKEMTLEPFGLGRSSVCVIENIIYSYCPSEHFEWCYSSVASVQRKLEGLEGLPKFARYSSVTLVDYGGKMVVLWDKYLPASGYKEKMIWCAVISLEKRSSEEIWGKVEWFDAVLTVPKPYKFVYAIAATV